MSNSFNISVKPEIAAAVVKIDAIDTVVDNIRGTDVPNIQTNIDANETIINAVGSVVGDIHSVDVPNIQTNINANETKIDTAITNIGTVDGIVDAIKLKTDTIPQSIRGTFNNAYLSTDSSSFVDLLNITGRGKIWKITCGGYQADEAIEVRLTVDGTIFQTFAHTYTGTGSELWIALVPHPTCSSTPGISHLVNTSFVFSLEFDTSLRIEVRRTAGSYVNYFGCGYSLD